LPIGVTSFGTMSDWVAVKIFSNYHNKIVTACARYCHDRAKWFVSGGVYNNENDVIEWLVEN
jgi:hypothetical protein